MDSRIILRMAPLTFIISKAGATDPSLAGINCWDTTACSTMDSCTRICGCWLGGNASITRSMVLAAPTVCKVEKTRCPVSAAVKAVLMVS